MRSWFGLIALTGFVVGTSLFIWTWQDEAAMGTWVGSYGCPVVFGVASVAGVASLLRRERWRAGSSFLIGIMLALLFASWFITASTIRAVFEGFSQPASHQVK